MKVLIADDHTLLRAGLATTIAHLDPGARTYEAADAAEVLATIGAHPDIDLILLDLYMPGANGFALLSKVCGGPCAAPVVVFSGSEEPAHMRQALDCGAAGFITKSTAREVVLSALRLVLAGGMYVPRELLQTPAAGELRAPMEGWTDKLTPRQQEVLRLLGQGRSNKQIARTLDLSENTVKIHVAGILRAAGAANRTEAVMQARELGFDFSVA